MRKVHVFLIAIGSFVSVLIAGNAEAAIVVCSSPFTLLTDAETDSAVADAHIVALSDTTACSAVCTTTGAGDKRAYVDFADRQLYAALLAAYLKGGTHSFAVDTAATTKGSAGVHGTTSCRIISFWL